MSTTGNTIRIIARVRPLLGGEIEEDIVVHTEGTAISVPNPKNGNENYTFKFNATHNAKSNQALLFAEGEFGLTDLRIILRLTNNVVSPTLKHLFGGNDVTIFAYGATGSGKTYTMCGQRATEERGIIPRLLTAIYHHGKELKCKTMAATMSYYEIYNDRVFDLFVSPEKRTLSGLLLRDNGGKTVVVGLMEKEIGSLEEFETLYDKANSNRSTSATKLNAHSSRSHAIICVRVTIVNRETGETRVGTVSCIDLAGNQDNRRTANDKERMMESASTNKSLFVLAQCIEAITKKQTRIPYRESKMTRILSLGQNNGLTVMILNLAPTKAFHMDTLSALNFANRAKKIELKQAETDYTTKLSSRQQLPVIRSFGTIKTNTTQLPNKFQKATCAPHQLASSNRSLMSAQLSGRNIQDLIDRKVNEAFVVFTENDHFDVDAAVSRHPEPSVDSYDDDVSWEELDDRMDTDYVPPDIMQTPRTQQLLRIINSEDVGQITKLKVCFPCIWGITRTN